MKNYMEKVSAIVAIYKSEKFLPKLLNSIINQTWCNLEILLIDDGSPDNSGNICDEYAKKDRRIRVIHKKMGEHVRQEMSDLRKLQVTIFLLLMEMIGLKKTMLNIS